MFGLFFKRDDKLEEDEIKKSVSSYGFIADNKKHTTYSEFKLV